MTHRIPAIALAAIGFVLLAITAGCHFEEHSTGPSHHRHHSHVEERNIPLDGAPPTSLDVETVNGSIMVSGIQHGNGTVHATIRVEADSDWEAEALARDIVIHVDRSGGFVQVYAAYPRPPHDVSVEVSFDIACREGTNLDLAGVNGGIEISRMRGAVAASVVNGRIDADLTLLAGAGRFSSTNGSIHVRTTQCDGPLTATAVNGNIDVSLPDSFAGLLNAHTANGSIRCDLPLSEVYSQSQTRLSGRIGFGRDTSISLQTANGGIHISHD